MAVVDKATVLPGVGRPSSYCGQQPSACGGFRQ